MLLKKTLAQVFSREFCKISQSNFLHRTPLMAASDVSRRLFRSFLTRAIERIHIQKPKTTYICMLMTFKGNNKYTRPISIDVRSCLCCFSVQNSTYSTHVTFNFEHVFAWWGSLIILNVFHGS